MLHLESGKIIGINTFRHELYDVLSQRLNAWYRHPSAAAFPIIRDAIEYSLKYTYVGLNHAVSIDYAREELDRLHV